MEDARLRRLRLPELRDLVLALSEPPAGLFLPVLELRDDPGERAVVGRPGEGFALGGQSPAPRGELVPPGPPVGERRFGGVGLPSLRLPPGPKRFVLHPERSEGPFRGFEPALGLGGARAGVLEPGSLTLEPALELLQSEPVGLRLAFGLAERLLAAGEGLAQVSTLAPELRNRFLGPAHFRAHLEGRPVSLVVLVGRLPVRGPRPLEVRLDRPLPGTRRLELHLLRADCRAPLLRLAREALPAKREQLRPQAALLSLEGGVPLGLRGLALQASELLVKLLAQIAQPGEVVVRLAHPALGLAAALAVERDPGCLLEKAAQLLRPRLDEAGDRSLLDDGVASRAETGAEEEVGDVPPPAPRSVQVVDGLAFAVDDASDRDLFPARETPPDPAVGVVEEQLDRRLADRPARGGAVEDHVHEELAAELPGRALAHHPANRVDDVGLAAAVGPDDSDEVPGKLDRDRIDERLETGEPNPAQPHVPARPGISETDPGRVRNRPRFPGFSGKGRIRTVTLHQPTAGNVGEHARE